jgi:hypothetical protein
MPAMIFEAFISISSFLVSDDRPPVVGDTATGRV